MTTLFPLFRPPSDEVVVAWVKGISALAGIDVSTSLPDEERWATRSFIQIQVVGGSPDEAVPFRRVIAQVSCYVKRTNSNKPAWNEAGSLASTVVDACYQNYVRTVQVTAKPALYDTADVRSVTVVSEPRRIPGDPSALARVDFDIEVIYIQSGWAAS